MYEETQTDMRFKKVYRFVTIILRNSARLNPRFVYLIQILYQDVQMFCFPRLEELALAESRDQARHFIRFRPMTLAPNKGIFLSVTLKYYIFHACNGKIRSFYFKR
jgi:hypothetical protein